MQVRQTLRWVALVAVLLVPTVKRAQAQASAIPSAQGGTDVLNENHGRKLLDEMVTALGGNAWLYRTGWIEEGKVASFYKGKPNDSEFGYESFLRLQPFAERRILIDHFGVIIGTDHKDIAQIWTPDAGYEVTYKGKTSVKKEDLEEYQRRRAHSLDVLVKDWLKQPGVVVTFEGSGMSGRRLVDKVSILTANNDAMTLQLDETTHLPLSRSYPFRDPVYHDGDVDEEQYDNYQPTQGIMTPMTVTRIHNGDMVSQRFVIKIKYNVEMSPDLFYPDKLLKKK